MHHCDCSYDKAIHNEICQAIIYLTTSLIKSHHSLHGFNRIALIYLVTLCSELRTRAGNYSGL